MSSHRIEPWRLPSEGEWRLLDRLVAGEVNPDEQETITALVSRDNTLGDLLQIMRGPQAAENDPDHETERAWKEMRVRIAAQKIGTPLRLVAQDFSSEFSSGMFETRPQVSALPLMTIRPLWKRSVTRYIAAFGVIAGTVITVLSWQPWSQDKPKGGAMHEMATQAGQQATIRLTDGTQVTIGPQTRIQVSSTFGQNERTVTLDGEAMFEVAPMSNAPFVVQTRQSITRVLGTKFNVRAYSDTTIVAVLDGKVALNSTKETTPGVIVTAGYIGTLSPSGDIQVQRGDLDLYTAWVKKRFVFRDTPVSEVLSTLSRWYGVRFSVTDSSLVQRRLTADWENRSLESVLQSLAFAFNARVVTEGDDITLSVK